ncbi:Rne/Rng family ribonuclease [Stigmatella sp. ncwal1]|uniref:Rne/Rng family ribonuclease n=1 Tax=Stigmatella ashevillensis TaxID=2995309 RepID=A0ABT5D7N0_9BACT|nr:Rne/Rng family ribonuclease [Stigmatella ashevillena]MDC0709654.1 Rne/Rng family ribonuclease [Stigmatella ashevillena]
MGSILVINAAGRETRVALVEGGHIAEFYLERKKDKGVVGNIYKGRVVRVLPGMQAAFVDIGLEKAAFLYVSDVVYDPDFARAQFELTEGEHEDFPEVPTESEAEAAEAAAGDTPAAPDAEVELEVQELAPGELPPPQGEPPALPPEAVAIVAPIVEGASPAQETAPVSAPATEAVPPAAELSITAVESTQIVEAPLETITPPPPPAAAFETAEVAPPAPPEAAVSEAAPAAPVAPSPEAGPAQALQAEPPPASATALGELIPVPSAPAETPVPAARPAAATTGERRTPREGREAREPRHREKERDGRDKDKARRPRDEHSRRDKDEKSKVRKSSRIEDLLKVGQEVVVQISKDPIGTKGARLTSHISIPGRHLVFMPTVDHVGISRRISNEKERKRLREIVDRLRPPGTGFIVRTVAENVPQEKLETDIRFLIEVWNQVVRRNEKRGGPGLLHPDLDLILRATRDLFAHDVEKLVVDDREEYERILAFVTAQDSLLKDRVVLHDGDEPVFDAYGIEQEMHRATQRKVWLKSGGYLIIDQAEALTAIDVNSGRYVGKKSLEETITKINVEAAKEIVYQLRLRNIGGIIICDFIDMEKAQNRDKVFKSLQEALGRDKAKTNVLRISELGLVEMTRKRVRESIGRVLHEDCPYCDGRGFVKTATTVTYEIFREIRREAPGYKDSTLVINCSAEVARQLQGEERQELRHLMDRYNKSIQVKAQQNYHREQYDIYGRSGMGPEHKVASSPGSGDGELAMQRRPENGGHGERYRQEQGRRGGGRGDRNERGGGDRSDRNERGGGDRSDRNGGDRGDRNERSGGDRGDRNERGGGDRNERGERNDRREGRRPERGDRNRGGERRGDDRRGESQRPQQTTASQEPSAPAGGTPPPPVTSGGGTEPEGGGQS